MIKVCKRLEYYQRLLAESDFRNRSSHEQAVILNTAYGLRPVDVQTLTGVKKDALRRAVKAMREGRDLGKNGCPRHYTTLEEELIVGEVVDKLSNDEEVNYESIRLIVRRSNGTIFQNLSIIVG